MTPGTEALRAVVQDVLEDLDLEVATDVAAAVEVTGDGATVGALAAAGVTVDDLIAVAVDGDTAVVLTR